MCMYNNLAIFRHLQKIIQTILMFIKRFMEQLTFLLVSEEKRKILHIKFILVKISSLYMVMGNNL